MKKALLKTLENFICDYFNISKKDLLKGSKKGVICEARFVLWYLIRNNIFLTGIDDCQKTLIFMEIAARYGYKYSNIIHGVRTIEERERYDKKYKEKIKEITSKLKDYGKN